MDILKSLKNRLALMINRAILTSLNDESARQFIQLRALKGETKDKVQRVIDYGDISNPLAGAEVIMLCVGGGRNHPVAIAADDPRYRPTGGEPGETGKYHYEGHTIRLLKDGIVQIECNQLLVKASDKIRFETPELEVTGEIVDLCDTNGESMRSMREIYNMHTHPENDSGGPTDNPNQLMGE